ncbi:MAG TPA: hypothetical protein VFR58_03240 [Flavisolibacter sp.]|nr:hypothetical protein [Flavisolibacter sp.]
MSHNKLISIATIAWAKNESEALLLKRSLSALAALGLPVFVTDAGSGEDFRSFLQSFPHFHLTPAPVRGVFAQARQSLEAAYHHGSSYILYTEPDKEFFFSQFLEPMLQGLENPGETGILLASRNAEGFSSFPAFQQMTETAINNCCAEVLGQQLDYTYGPFLLRAGLVPMIAQLEEDPGWGWRPFAFGLARRLGLPIQSFEAAFTCPPGQEQDDAGERFYRIRQLKENLQGLLLSKSFELKKPEE